MQLTDLFQGYEPGSDVDVIYGTALGDSADGLVLVQVGDELPAAASVTTEEDAFALDSSDYNVELDEEMDSDVEEDERAEEPYSSEDEGADVETEDDVASEGTFIEDSDELGEGGEADPLETIESDDEDPLTETEEE